LFFSVLFLFLLVTGISLFIPSNIRISKAINIAAPADSVFNQVGDPVKWKNWFPGLESSTVFYEAGTVKGVRIGDSSKQYIRITEKKKDEVVAELRSGSKKIISGWKLISYVESGSTTLQWYMDFKLRWYPWEKFSSLLFEKSYGIRMEQGLNNIKKLVEADRTSSN
jgi:ribosome-associated toxin RatA of RatAB toxin-antitoxin module